ncbi:hypothetical protein FJ434_20545 [Mesorhizobium sp. B2-5-13]|uniref:hypothetical protein n=1 Tax=unclassified Mesorhizobium TaxID=325217 RepID=UPI0011279044|nr:MULTISPECIES: hypothetical protein [unclassified Mesorhizobium]TPJ81891.1 hypothetical protein FJ434_20545 [Mesorhizobium sp. B2-5-13]TPK45921.1 hypothetical protein FJ560_20320 [Mesorhizobium sp. B2-5-5]
MTDRDSISFDWNDIVATYLSQPWWVWPAGCVVAWLGLRWVIGAMRAYRERPILCDSALRQCGVRVDYDAGTITLPRGDSFPLQRVRGLRWEDYATSGSYHAIVDVDDVQRPIHRVALSTPTGPEALVARLRTAIESAGGPRFAVAATDRMEVVEKDLSDPIMAAVATRVRPLGWRRSYLKSE